MPTQLSKLALVNPSVDENGDFDALSETKSFSVVQEGAAEASRQVISIEPNTQVIENNREIITSKNYNITVTGVYSDSTKTQLYTWASAQTNLVFTGYGLDGSILQMEGTLQINKGFEDNMSFRFSSAREAKGGYSSSDGKHSAEMSYVKNGLALYGWGDADEDDLANDWTDTGSIADGFADGVQTIAGAGNLSRTIHFPFSGVQLAFFADFTSVSDNTGLSVDIEAYNSSNSELGSGGTLTVPLSAGVRMAFYDLPENTAYVKVKVTGGSGSGALFKNPTLQITNFTGSTSLANKQAAYNFVEFNT
jgi:hypothetical protein